MREMDEVCYDKVHQFVSKGHQVLVFVTARNATIKLATTFRDEAAKKVSFLLHFIFLRYILRPAYTFQTVFLFSINGRQ